MTFSETIHALSPDSCFSLAPGVIFQEIQDDVVILNIRTQEYYSLNFVGAEILRLLLDGADLAAVAGQIESRFRTAPQTAQSDLYDLVGNLVDQGLLKPGAAQ